MAEERSNPFLTKTQGKGDKGSRPKAEKASEQANEEAKRVLDDSQPPGEEKWPVNANGVPMLKAEMSAAELIPTGQYANVTVGPCRIHFLIDPDRQLRDDESYWTPAQRATIAAALNEAAELVESDVVAVQRNLVLESMQQQGS
jgi:hypothetical protein